MKDVAVISSCGILLMPTSRYRARKLLKSGKAVICQYAPVFTIRLLYRETGDIQPIELKVDTGYQHIGISVCSEKHEYLHREYSLLKEETEHHNDCRKYRRTRRNRLRYRKPRWQNRRGLISKEGFAPSIRHKLEAHVDIIRRICEVMPVTKGILEMGQFDTQLLKAQEAGLPLPQGTDYQHGERYGIATLREAVFTRDNYQCICCGRSGLSRKDRAVLHVHHIGYWKHDRTNRMGNLATVCEKCHTSANHQPNGKLYGLSPKLKTFKGATFMTMVRYRMFQRVQTACPDIEFHMTYGAMTKLQRERLNLPKGHANDAYAMGEFHPKHRCHLQCYQKRKRNNRILEKFYDASYTDLRDGVRKKASQLGCNRIDRSIPRNNKNNERHFRGTKNANGHRNIRKGRHCFQAGDIVSYKGKKQTVKTVRFKTRKKSGNYETVEFKDTGRQVLANNVTLIKYAPVWQVV